MGTFYPTNDYRNYISHAKRTGRVTNLRARRANAVKSKPNPNGDSPTSSNPNYWEEFLNRHDPRNREFEEQHEAASQEYRRQRQQEQLDQQHAIDRAHREYEAQEARRRQEDLDALEEHRRAAESNRARVHRLDVPRKNPDPNSFRNGRKKQPQRRR